MSTQALQQVVRTVCGDDAPLSTPPWDVLLRAIWNTQVDDGKDLKGFRFAAETSTQPQGLEWTPESALDVSDWARDQIGKRRTKGAKLLRDMLSKGEPRVVILLLALRSYLQQLGAQYSPGLPDDLLLGVDNPQVRTATSLQGVRAKSRRGDVQSVSRAPYSDPTAPDSVEFRWFDDAGAQQQLELPFNEGCGPLEAISRTYGEAAVRDLMALYFQQWASRAPAGKSFWWYPDEHLRICGLSNTKENRRIVRNRLRRLATTKLIVRYAKGSPMTGPLVSLTQETRDAAAVHIHQALVHGFIREDGTLGTYYWPVPLSLLALPSGTTTGKVHIFTSVAGQLFRTNLHDGKSHARIGANTLADRLGLDRDRQLPSRRAAALRATLEKAKETGFLGAYRVTGDLDSMDATISMSPGPRVSEFLTADRHIPRPPKLPATGAELADWIRVKRLSRKEAAEILGVDYSHLRYALSRYRDRPIPAQLRRTLRSLIWRLDIIDEPDIDEPDIDEPDFIKRPDMIEKPL